MVGCLSIIDKITQDTVVPLDSPIKKLFDFVPAKSFLIFMVQEQWNFLEMVYQRHIGISKGY